MEIKEQNLIQEYSELTQKEKELEIRKKEIASILLEHMSSNKIDTIKSDVGTFSKAKKQIYEYPEEFKEKEKGIKLSLEKEKEELEKTLTPNIKEYIVFRAK